MRVKAIMGSYLVLAPVERPDRAVNVPLHEEFDEETLVAWVRNSFKTLRNGLAAEQGVQGATGTIRTLSG